MIVQNCKRFIVVVICSIMLSSCATTQLGSVKVLYGADATYDAAMSACATSYNSKLIGEAGKAKCIELGGYYVTARAQAAKAIELYNTTKDAASLEQVNYWVNYALGVVAAIVVEMGKAGV